MGLRFAVWPKALTEEFTKRVLGVLDTRSVFTDQDRRTLIADLASRPDQIRPESRPSFVDYVLQQAGIEVASASTALTAWSRVIKPSDGFATALAAVSAALLASASGDRLIVWSPTTGQAIDIAAGLPNSLIDLVAADGDELHTLGSDGTITAWRCDPLRTTGSAPGSAGRRRLARDIDGHIRAFDHAVAAPPDGQWRADGRSSGHIDLAKADSTHQRIEGHFTGALGYRYDITALSTSRDGNCLASGSLTGSIRLWNPATGSLIRTLPGHNRNVSALAMSAHGSWLASASATDRSVRLWQVSSGQPLGTLTTTADGVKRLAIAPDDSWIAAAGTDGSIQIWGFTPGPDVTPRQAPRGEHDGPVLQP